VRAAGTVSRGWLRQGSTGVAALYLGREEGKNLVYMGKVGTGWSRMVSSQIRRQLNAVVVPKPRLAKPMLRAASFKGLSRRN